jgi:hypothetical protein
MTKNLPRTCHRWLSNPGSVMRNCRLSWCRCVIPGLPCDPQAVNAGQQEDHSEE